MSNKGRCREYKVVRDFGQNFRGVFSNILLHDLTSFLFGTNSEMAWMKNIIESMGDCQIKLLPTTSREAILSNGKYFSGILAYPFIFAGAKIANRTRQNKVIYRFHSSGKGM